ncbi:MAG: hypothetical protein Q4A98_04500 [Comamonadaceae bacterium]|nr:hypothetical protein [Comamonadaceae bacterium]
MRSGLSLKEQVAAHGIAQRPDEQMARRHHDKTGLAGPVFINQKENKLPCFGMMVNTSIFL